MKHTFAAGAVAIVATAFAHQPHTSASWLRSPLDASAQAAEIPSRAEDEPTAAAALKRGLDAANSNDYATAMVQFRIAAEDGNAVADYNIGFMYQNGLGVAPDYAQAMQFYQLAAARGETSALNQIGFLYRNGLGVTQDYVQAMHWYRLAADKGYAIGQYNVGFLYANGLGVDQSATAARDWMTKAAAQGEVDAQQWLAQHPQ
jgi:TPR repeat protein